MKNEELREEKEKAESQVESGKQEETPAETPDEKSTETPAERPEKPEEPDWKDLYARLLADFDNFKKRTAREREDTYRFAESDVLGDMLPVVDNMALAIDKAENKEDPFVQGVMLVYDSLLKALKDHGAEPFDSVGEVLDTAKMEAVASLPSETVEEGKVSNEVKRGWLHKGKVLRAAQVVVSAGRKE
ncbi:MAG: nucleotide exchange factor GrpE [Kiritimatiellae bacterium]|nr:nucleotide exchange factor GrpE [Kiritimatiellia bacterium]